MKTATRQPGRIGEVATLLISVALMSTVAWYNRFPLVYADTGGYLTSQNAGFRSFLFNLFIFPSRLTHTLWTVVFAQALLLTCLLRLVFREVFIITSRTEFLAVIALLCALTSLPWYVGLVMPDLYTPMLALGLFLMVFCFERLSRWERCYFVALTFVAATVHLTHLPIAIGLLLIAWIARLALRDRTPDPVPDLRRPAILIATGFVAVVLSNYLTLGIMTYSVNGYAFELARLLADGQAVGYLEENCATRKFKMCGYLGRLPNQSAEILWNPDGPFKQLGWLSERQEARESVVGTVKRYPLWTAESAISNTLEQLREIQTGNGSVSISDAGYPARRIGKFYPADVGGYEHSRQYRGELSPSRLKGLNQLHIGIVIFSLIYSTLIAIVIAKDGQWLPVKLLITIELTILLNALLVGTISDPIGRYGSRVIWLLPMFAIASWRLALGLGSPTSSAQRASSGSG